MRSPEAVRALVARTEIQMPESEIRATRVFGPNGQFLRPVTPEPIVRAVAQIVEHPDYGAIHAPILAIYTAYQTPAQLLPRYQVVDRETRQALDEIFQLWCQFAAAQRDLFQKSVPQAHIVVIQGASHYLFLSHRDKTLHEIRAFLLTP